MGNTGEPSLIFTGDGGFLLSYTKQTDGVAELLVRKLTGETWSEPKVVAAADNLLVNWADFPTIIEYKGVLVAQWMVRQAGAGFAYDVYVAQSKDGGNSWSQPTRLHLDESPVEHGFVSLYADGRGFGAFWLDGHRYAGDNQNDIGMELRHRRLFAQTEEDVVDDLVCDCCQTDAVVYKETPVVAYRDRSREEIRDISIARFSGDRWLTSAVAADGWEITGCPVNGPAMAATDDEIAVAWFTAEPTNRVRMAVSKDGGESFLTPVDLDVEQPVGRVDIESLGSQRWVVSWIAGNGELTYRDIGRDGSLGATTVVAQMDVSRNAGFPRMAVSGDRLVFAWTDTKSATSQVRVTATKGYDRDRRSIN